MTSVDESEDETKWLDDRDNVDKCDIISVGSVDDSVEHDVISSDTSLRTLTSTMPSDESHSVAEHNSDSDDLFDVDITCDMTDDKGLPTLPVQFGNIDTFALLDCASKLNLVLISFFN